MLPKARNDSSCDNLKFTVYFRFLYNHIYRRIIGRIMTRVKWHGHVADRPRRSGELWALLSTSLIRQPSFLSSCAFFTRQKHALTKWCFCCSGFPVKGSSLFGHPYSIHHGPLSCRLSSKSLPFALVRVSELLPLEKAWTWRNPGSFPQSQRS